MAIGQRPIVKPTGKRSHSRKAQSQLAAEKQALPILRVGANEFRLNTERKPFTLALGAKTLMRLLT
jgi:hypothetical protein